MDNINLIINISLASVIIARFIDHTHFPVQTKTYSQFKITTQNNYQLKQLWNMKGRIIVYKINSSP
jgi:hypothetical protein